MLFILVALFVGHLGAMDVPSKMSAKEKLELLLKKLPTELQMPILSIRINQLLEAPFPKAASLNFAISFLSLIAQFPQKYKKEYLNKFAKKWFLTYGKEKELKPISWIEKHFPDQIPEQVLDYRFSIAELLNAGRISTIRSPGILNLSKQRINNLDGLDQIPNKERIRKLYIEENQFTTIPVDAFAGFTNLLELKLGANHINDIQINAFASLNSLQILSLMRNQINYIKANAFVGLNSLQILNLNNNQINIITDDTFSGLHELKSLMLDNNTIVDISDNAFNAFKSSIKEIKLYNNPLSPQLKKKLKKLKKQFGIFRVKF